MNAPTYEKKDYSYLPETFQRASQGFRQFGQGLKTAMDIEGTERKRAQEDEIINNVRISNEEAELVRENLIADFATEIMKSKGLPSTDEGREAAYNIAVRYVYPLTPEERKSGTGLKRLWTQEQDKIPQFLKNEAVKNWMDQVYQSTGRREFPKKQDIQEPVGTVGVEEEGGVRRPLASGPLSEREMRQAAGRTLAEQPSYIESMPSLAEFDPQEFYRKAVELGIQDDPRVQGVMENLIPQQIMGQEREAPITGRTYAEERTALPYAKEEKMLPYFKKELEEKDLLKLEIDKIRALKKPDNKDQADKNILKMKDSVDRLREQYIKNGSSINRLGQALQRLKKGKSLGGFAALLQDITADPNNPSEYELQSEIDRLRISNESIKDAMDEADSAVSDMSGGLSLKEAILKIEKDRKKASDDAVAYVREHIAPLASEGTTLGHILGTLKEQAPGHYKALKRQVQKAKDAGVMDKDIAYRILGWK